MTQTLCRRNKHGYCNHGDKCRFRHVNEKCETPDCNVFNCEKRHPKICNFINQYGRCKFTIYCKYDHEKPKNVLENKAKTTELEKKFENLQKNTQSKDLGNMTK